MIKKIFYRILIFIPTILLISLLAFIISVNAPGDPVEKLAIAMGQDGASSQNQSTNLAAKNKIRKSLGLDRPLFYIGLGTLADCDTLYKIIDRQEREALEVLNREVGNWDLLMKFNQLVLKKNDEIVTELIDSTLSQDQKDIKSQVIFQLNMLKITKSLKDLKRRIVQIDTLNLNLNAGIEFQDLNAAFLNMEKRSSTWESYVPNLNLYGINNQYHIWLFGDWLLKKDVSQVLITGTDLDSVVKQYVKKEVEVNNKLYSIEKYSDTEFTIQLMKSKVNQEWTEEDDASFLVFKNENNKYYYEIDNGRKGAVRGDFGKSFVDGQSVSSKLWEKFKVSFRFIIFSIFLAYFVSIPIGLYSAYKKDGLFDRVSTVVLFVLYSLPSFFVGTVLLYTFSNPDQWLWFPESGLYDASVDIDAMSFWDGIVHQAPYHVLPLIVYSYSSFAFLSRIMRVGMVDVIGQDYIRTARAKGLSEKKVVLKHALRNSLIPLITVFSNVFPAAVGGSVIIEVIFSIQGMGLEGYNAILNYDYPMIMAIFTISGALTVFGYLVADVLYSVVDPRISMKK
tara:strand:+ start:7032 stop:8723 length:1692 start_codon:yes stop_codon:yes gene_type:complete